MCWPRADQAGPRVRFRRIHTVDSGLVCNRYWCEIEDPEVSCGEIGQGYEMAGGRIIPLTDEELRQLPLPTAGVLIPARMGRDRRAATKPRRLTLDCSIVRVLLSVGPRPGASWRGGGIHPPNRSRWR
ncbi:hypothetical protein ACFCYR_45600, partial [Streptomyces sp. NPDC056291]